jgi:sortase A
MSLRFRRLCIGALAAIGTWQLSAGLYIHAKAWLAQELIAASWADTLAGSRAVRPWPWADTWPVARLQVPGTTTELYVLADASGRSLAFGPGYLSGSAQPGARGNTIIAAHRDTHFRFLRDAPLGTEISLQTADGREHRYRIVASHIIDTRFEHLSLELDRPTLSLVTCYPFEAVVPGGPLRFVAVAEAVEPVVLLRAL